MKEMNFVPHTIPAFGFSDWKKNLSVLPQDSLPGKTSTFKAIAPEMDSQAKYVMILAPPKGVVIKYVYMYAVVTR